MTSFNKRFYLLLTAGWFFLVFPGVFYGLPQVLDPDELLFVRGALMMLVPSHYGPVWYGAPASTLMDILAPIYAVYAVAVTLSGVGGAEGFHPAHHIPDLVLIGRLVTALAMLIATLLMFGFTRRLLGTAGALSASLALLFSPGLVSFSQVTRMDIFMILFMLIAIHLSTKIIYTPRVLYFALAGIAVGAAMVSKYPGVVVSIAVLAAGVIACVRGNIGPSAAAGALGLSAICSVATSFVLAPYLFINFDKTIHDVLHEARETHLGATSLGFTDNIKFYFFTGGPDVSGRTMWWAGLVGFFLHLCRDRRSPLILYVVFGLAFLVFISALSLQWARWALPLAAVAAVGVGALVSEVESSLSLFDRRRVLAATSCVMVVVLVPSFFSSAKMTVLKARNRDTRVIGMEWIRQNVPQGTRIALETYTPQLSIDEYQILIPSEGEILPLQQVNPMSRRPDPFFGSFGSHTVRFTGQLPEIIILSNWEARFAREKNRYKQENTIYQKIHEIYEPIARFQSGPFMLGPTITVLRPR